LYALLNPLVQAIDAGRILEHTKTLVEKNRVPDFPHFAEAAGYTETVLRDLGLEVDRLEIPADGETRLGDAVMPLAWECTEASIEVVFPTEKTLVTLAESPLCVGMWSPPTPEEGLEAEVVFLNEGVPSELTSQDVKGKWIYTPGRLDAIRETAARLEAAGVISSWLPNKDHTTDVQWIQRNTNTPGGWGTKKDEPALVALALSPQDGAALVQWAAEGPVRLRVKVKSRLFPGTLPVISAVIPGDPGEEEVWLSAPLYGPGANYNASNAAALLEAARILKDLVDSGKFLKPLRGIRFLWGPKLYGALAYVKQRNENARRARYALYIDAGAGSPDSAWSRWQYRMTPVTQRHFADGLAWNVFKLYLQAWRPQRCLETKSFMLSGDTLFNDPQIGIPTHWLYSGTEKECRNTSADTLETVDRRSCIDLVAPAAAMVFTMASIGTADIPDLAFWNFNLAQDRLREDVQVYLDRAKEARNNNDLNELLGEASRHIPGRVRIETRILESLAGLGEGAEQMLEWESVREAISALQDLGKAAMSLLRAYLNVQADQLGVPSTKLEVAAEPAEDKRIPTRVGGTVGTITLDNLPLDRWTTPVKDSPRHNVPFILAWWLADGTRTIGEIQRLLHYEIARYRECIPAWFTFLEKNGYVTWQGGEEKPAKGS